MNIFDTPKIDCHAHILDPQRFHYAQKTTLNAAASNYAPSGQETASAPYFAGVMAAYGVRHALLVGPNSGYGTDNRCMLDAIALGAGRFKGVAVVANDTSTEQLQALQAQGIVGITFNMALLGVDFYANCAPLLKRLEDLGLFAQLQVQAPKLPSVLKLFLDSGASLVIDHCGRPAADLGLQDAGFQALLALGRAQRAVVKLSGFDKFASADTVFADSAGHVQALLDAFGPTHCVWASDWPHLRAQSRLDYGLLLKLFETQVANADDRQAVLWDTPRRVFGFGCSA